MAKLVKHKHLAKLYAQQKDAENTQLLDRVIWAYGEKENLRFTLFRADGASHLGEPTDATEAARVEWVPIWNLRKLIEEGHITDGPTLMALSFALSFSPPESR